jgi:hypothetical protein
MIVLFNSARLLDLHQLGRQKSDAGNRKALKNKELLEGRYVFFIKIL